MGQQTETSPGVFPFVVPSGVSVLTLAVTIAGGGGGTTSIPDPAEAGAPGAGAGGFASATSISVTPNETLDLYVGVGGGPDADGGDSAVGRGFVTLCSATGGKTSVDQVSAGLGGVGVVGDTLWNGGDGNIGDIGGGAGGGGGGSNGSGAGGNGGAGFGAIGGAGGLGTGTGGDGGAHQANGSAGNAPAGAGGGGGGDTGTPFPGGAGAAGYVEVNWDDPPNVSSCSPPTGSVAGGDMVSVLGSNFDNGATVDFGTGPQAATWVNSGQLDVLTPGSTPGLKNVTVVNPNNNFGTGVGKFTYVNPTPPVYPPFGRRKRQYFT